ncbi:hypothetical protein KR044_009247 [Drosophila immigrans]|nr:hypothetical protein KR044_009247 [Drosophila immigrans]
MSDDESSDGMEDLKALMAIYKQHEGESQDEKPSSGQAKEEETGYVEVPMEKVIFGDKQAFLTNLAKSVGKKRQKVDKDSDADADDDESAKRPKAAWHDSDDEELEVGEVKRQTRHTGPLNHLRKDKSYKEYLTARFQRAVNQPKWASLKPKKENSENEDSEDEALLKTVGFIDHKAKTRELRAKSIFFKRVKDLNRATYSEGVITSVQFHPTSTAALVAGESCLATIYSVNGQKNEKLHNIRFRQFAITCARIAPCGTKAFFGAMQRHYYAYDLLEAKETKLKLPPHIKTSHKFEVSPCGKYIVTMGEYGAIHVLTTASNELLHTFKQEGQLRGMCWTADSKRIICCGSSCNVNVLSMRELCVEHSFIDDGCVNGRTIALAPNQQMLATGSNEGVVNIYDYEKIYKSTAPQPEKRFMNLRTAIGELTFNPTSELLAMGSRLAPNALKLAHFPSATVYSNFPGQQENVGYVNTMAFSPGSGFLAIGCRGKKVPLFRLKHFKNY